MALSARCWLAQRPARGGRPPRPGARGERRPPRGAAAAAAARAQAALAKRARELPAPKTAAAANAAVVAAIAGTATATGAWPAAAGAHDAGALPWGGRRGGAPGPGRAWLRAAAALQLLGYRVTGRWLTCRDACCSLRSPPPRAGRLLPAALAVVPINDDYLKSTPINRADTRLTREEVKTTVDTTEATTQPDLFAPETAGGGGPETTVCGGRAFGKTVWYDLHPDVDGAVEIQTGGFDVAIGLYEFDNRTAKILRLVQCSAEPGTQDFIPSSRLKAKRHYTVQIGGLDNGLGPLGGTLGISFQFFADRDDDDIFDPLDACPDQPGVREAGGCPPELRSTPKLTASPTAAGITVRSSACRRARAPRSRCAAGAAARVTRRGRPASCRSRCCAGARCRRARSSRSS